MSPKDETATAAVSYCWAVIGEYALWRRLGVQLTLDKNPARHHGPCGGSPTPERLVSWVVVRLRTDTSPISVWLQHCVRFSIKPTQ